MKARSKFKKWYVLGEGFVERRNDTGIGAAMCFSEYDHMKKPSCYRIVAGDVPEGKYRLILAEIRSARCPTRKNEPTDKKTEKRTYDEKN